MKEAPHPSQLGISKRPDSLSDYEMLVLENMVLSDLHQKLHFIMVISILSKKINFFHWLKKCVTKFLSSTRLYFQQTYCGWDMSPKRLWAEIFSYSLHSEMGIFSDIYFMNHNQPPLKCGFRMCCEKSLWHNCNTISPLLSFPFLLSLLLCHCTW